MTVKDFDSVYDDAWLVVVEDDYSDNEEEKILYASYNDETLPLEVADRIITTIYAYDATPIDLAELGKTRYKVTEQDTIFRVYAK